MSVFGSPVPMSRPARPRQQPVVVKLMLVALLASGLVMNDPVLGALGPAHAAKSNRAADDDEPALSGPGSTPMLAVVSLKEQRITIYGANGRILRANVSTGQTGYETPAGIYSVIQKEEEHHSNLYDDASMPFMQRITWSGIALHAGALPGYPASHGCVRMPYDFAKRLFSLTKMGLRVVVARTDTSPAEIAHPLLFVPAPIHADASTVTPDQTTGESRPLSNATGPAMRLGAAPEPVAVSATAAARRIEALKSVAASRSAAASAAARKADEAKNTANLRAREAARAAKSLKAAEATTQRAQTQLANAERALTTASNPAQAQRAEEIKTRAQSVLAAAQSQHEAAVADLAPRSDAAARAADEATAAETARIAARDAAREAARKLSPVSVLISAKTQRLYVRQAFQPVFESAVNIRDPASPLGTHIYTAVDETLDGAGLRWTVVSMPGRAPDEPAASGTRSRQRAEDRKAEPPSSDARMAAAALERIELPPDAIARISETLLPGSSLIISDEPVSQETGKGTDFVVLMSGEPQGGVKIRSRPPDRERWRSERPYRGAPYGSRHGYRGSAFYWR